MGDLQDPKMEVREYHIFLGGIFPYIERWSLIDMLFKIDGNDNWYYDRSDTKSLI